MVDVRSKRCEYIGCIKQPIYGIQGGSMQFCNAHKQSGMVDLRNKRCEHEACMKLFPVYDFAGGTGRFCADHRLSGMINVVSKQCLTCPTRSSNVCYKGYCYRCFIHAFPDNKIVRNHKTKERAVADFIRENFPDYDIAFDSRMQGGCSNRRPDICMDLGSHVVVIEIDENQHEDYDCSCENKRLMQLFVDGGSRPLIMIRFNPDGYKNHKQQSVSSCWGYTKDRCLCKVKDNKLREWNQRLDVLRSHVMHACNNECTQEVDVVHLFYDGWSL